MAGHSNKVARCVKVPSEGLKVIPLRSVNSNRFNLERYGLVWVWMGYKNEPNGPFLCLITRPMANPYMETEFENNDEPRRELHGCSTHGLCS